MFKLDSVQDLKKNHQGKHSERRGFKGVVYSGKGKP